MEPKTKPIQSQLSVVKKYDQLLLVLVNGCWKHTTRLLRVEWVERPKCNGLFANSDRANSQPPSAETMLLNCCQITMQSEVNHVCRLVDHRSGQLRQKSFRLDPGRNVANSAADAVYDADVALKVKVSTDLESIPFPQINEVAQVQNEVVGGSNSF